MNSVSCLQVAATMRIKQRFQQAELADKYDYILCSHVLYNVDLNDWPAFLAKMLNAVSSEGRAFDCDVSRPRPAS